VGGSLECFCGFAIKRTMLLGARSCRVGTLCVGRGWVLCWLGCGRLAGYPKCLHHSKLAVDNLWVRSALRCPAPCRRLPPVAGPCAVPAGAGQRSSGGLRGGGGGVAARGWCAGGGRLRCGGIACIHMHVAACMLLSAPLLSSAVDQSHRAV
jgi:hypothetical protein